MFYTGILQYVINTEERFAPDNSNAYMSQNKLSFENFAPKYMLMLRQFADPVPCNWEERKSKKTVHTVLIYSLELEVQYISRTLTKMPYMWHIGQL